METLTAPFKQPNSGSADPWRALPLLEENSVAPNGNNTPACIQRRDMGHIQTSVRLRPLSLSLSLFQLLQLCLSCTRSAAPWTALPSRGLSLTNPMESSWITSCNIMRRYCGTSAGFSCRVWGEEVVQRAYPGCCICLTTTEEVISLTAAGQVGGTGCQPFGAQCGSRGPCLMLRHCV